MKWEDEYKFGKWVMYEKDIIGFYYPRVIEWMDNGFQWSGMAFTSGLGRQIAGLVEEGIRRQCGEVKETNQKSGRYG